MDVKPKRRLTARKALDHSWLLRKSYSSDYEKDFYSSDFLIKKESKKEDKLRA